MEDDILNYSPTVMFRGTPCSSGNLEFNHEGFSAILVYLSFGQISQIARRSGSNSKVRQAIPN